MGSSHHGYAVAAGASAPTPGELGAARAFCAAVQERLLRSVCNLGARLPAYIRIAASVHTDIDMFTFSQPALEEGDGELVLQVF